jgi:hypothetical protein
MYSSKVTVAGMLHYTVRQKVTFVSEVPTASITAPFIDGIIGSGILVDNHLHTWLWACHIGITACRKLQGTSMEKSGGHRNLEKLQGGKHMGKNTGSANP